MHATRVARPTLNLYTSTFQLPARLGYSSLKSCVLQNYVRNLIDFENSVVGNLQNFDKIEQLLARGDNVVVLANHQTEADPGIITLSKLQTAARLGA